MIILAFPDTTRAGRSVPRPPGFVRQMNSFQRKRVCGERLVVLESAKRAARSMKALCSMPPSPRQGEGLELWVNPCRPVSTQTTFNWHRAVIPPKWEPRSRNPSTVELVILNERTNDG